MLGSRDRHALAPLCEAISRTAIHAVVPEHVATFLGRRLTSNFISTLEDPTNGTKALDKITEPKREADRTYEGFDFFSYKDRDLRLRLALVRGEHVISSSRD